MAGSQDGDILSGVALCRAHITDATVGMVMVIPMDEGRRPGTRLLQGCKTPLREFRPVLGGAKQGLHEGVVVRDPRTGVRRLHAKPMEHGEHRGGLQSGAIVAMQDGLFGETVDPFRKRRTPGEMRGMVGVIGVSDRGAHDLAAVEIEDEIQIKPASRDLGRQIGHIPAPDLSNGPQFLDTRFGGYLPLQ